MIANGGVVLTDDIYDVTGEGKTLEAQNETVTVGETTSKVTISVDFKGDAPKGENDTVTISNGEISAATLTINGYKITYTNGKVTKTEKA